MAGFIRRATGTITTVDADEVRRALALFADPGGGQELFSLPAGRSRTLPGSDLSGLVRAAAELAEGSTGVYWRMNPVPPDLGRPARVGDVAHRRWLLIDVDPVKPDGLADESATPEEKIHATMLGRDVVAWLAEEHGWPEPVFVDSGNGAQPLYRVNLPADKQTRTLFRRLLYTLADRFDTDKAKIDRKTHNATRLAKLPGTMARKGTATADRPHRMACILSAPPEVQIVTLEQIESVVGTDPTPTVVVGKDGVCPPLPPPQQEPGTHKLRATGGNGEAAWARAAFQAESGKVFAATEGERNQTLNNAAFSLGQIVGAGLLARGEVEAALLAAGKAVGLGDGEIEATIASGLNAGTLEPRRPPEKINGTARHNAGDYRADDEPPHVDADDVATIADLIRAGAQVEWDWHGWIQRGVLNAVAAKGGTGKTRWCADLVRRVRHRLEWPDGEPMTLDVPASGCVALWVVADNHHDEMVTLCRDFKIEDCVRLNASRSDPYGGVTLEAREDYQALEARVKAVRPAFVIVDTVGNATDKNLSRQEDAKAFYWPLQIIARKYRCSVLCLTHLNAAGHFLGRRVMEKVRVAIRMDHFDGNDKRRLEVMKSNSQRPAPLGVIMGEGGNDYDFEPPEPPEESAMPKVPTDAERKAMDWLKEQLSKGPKRVSITRDLGAAAGISSDKLYAAVRFMGAHSFSAEGYKWWALTPDEAF
jgi:hypothetical protein